MNTNAIGAISEIQSNIREIEANAALYEETNFSGRADAIDFMDFHIIDRIEGLLQNTGQHKKLEVLKHLAERIKCGLEEVDARVFKQLREKIGDGIYTGPSFREMMDTYLGYDVSGTGRTEEAGYDNLDIFINGLLAHQAIPEAGAAIEPEMVFYQKTPARIIFQMAAQAKLGRDDVFFDLGSGLGQAAILVNLISGATAIGVEFDPAYCNYARACTSRLNLNHVEFINKDARKGDYSRGTVFFMYTPFEGSMLQDMLEILQKEAQKRTVRIFTYGPCSPQVDLQSWLNCINGPAHHPHKLYEFISLGADNY